MRRAHISSNYAILFSSFISNWSTHIAEELIGLEGERMWSQTISGNFFGVNIIETFAETQSRLLDSETGIKQIVIFGNELIISTLNADQIVIVIEKVIICDRIEFVGEIELLELFE